MWIDQSLLVSISALILVWLQWFVIFNKMSKIKSMLYYFGFLFNNKKKTKLVKIQRKEQPTSHSPKDLGHKTNWQEAWQNGRSWLIYNDPTKSMTCSLCKKFKITGVNGPLTWSSTGCSTSDSYRLNKVKSHKQSLSSGSSFSWGWPAKPNSKGSNSQWCCTRDA